MREDPRHRAIASHFECLDVSHLHLNGRAAFYGHRSFAGLVVLAFALAGHVDH